MHDRDDLDDLEELDRLNSNVELDEAVCSPWTQLFAVNALRCTDDASFFVHVKPVITATLISATICRTSSTTIHNELHKSVHDYLVNVQYMYISFSRAISYCQILTMVFRVCTL